MIWQPIARIILRYIAFPVAIWFGLPDDTAAELATDPDLVVVVTAVVGLVAALVEGWYIWARRKGGAT